MNFITSVSNSKIKQIVKLASSRSYRYEHGLAVIYGHHLVEEALKFGILSSVFIRQGEIDKYKTLLSDFTSDNIYIVNDEILTKISIFDSVSDIIGLIRIKLGTITEDIYECDCVILDNIQDPGNLGTLIRSCVASGIQHILLSRSCVDPYNLKVLRASQGMQFKLNIITMVDIIKFITSYKYKVIATLPKAKDSIYDHDLTVPCAWLFGNEGTGISKVLLDNALCQLTIPMPGNSESLNVAMTVTTCLFEMLRQRRVVTPE